MRTAISLLLSAVCAVVLSFPGFAQDSTATSTLTLARVSLKKEFTQSITIKGTDLERMPFASLSDALQAWGYGYSSGNTNIVYAVDGVMINDVNVYSKYDIEEVVLVQNAVSTLNGAVATQILALVKTRKSGPKPSGFTVAGQSYQVRADPKQSSNTPTVESTKNYFHNYHIGGYLNSKTVQFTLSANYLRDVAPSFPATDVRVVQPQHNDRFGFNASLHTQLGRAHELTFRINATPQSGEYEVRRNGGTPVSDYYNLYREKTTIINPSVGLKSTLLPGFINELTASFGTGKGKADVEREVKNGQGGIENYYQAHSTTKAKQWVIMDNITYHAPLNNDWSLDPSLNLFYRHVKYDMESASITVTPGGGLGGATNITTNTMGQKGGIFLLTPSVNLYYRKSFNFQAGVQTNLSKTNGTDINKVLPFATTSIDVVKLFRPNGSTSLQLFGSVGQSDNLGDYRLNLETTLYIPTIGFVSYLPVIIPFQKKTTLWNWQTGTRLGLWNGRLALNYAYESRSYISAMVVEMRGNPNPSIVYAELLSRSHTINLQWQVLNRQSLNWRTSLSATTAKQKIQNLQTGIPITPLPGTSLSRKNSWTGGWANRFAFRHLTVGMDVLYLFNPDATSPGLTSTRIDAVSMANVYLGYVFPLNSNRTVELYANSRNPLQDKDLKNIESYKYYGLGFKATL